MSSSYNTCRKTIGNSFENYVNNLSKDSLKQLLIEMEDQIILINKQLKNLHIMDLVEKYGILIRFEEISQEKLNCLSDIRTCIINLPIAETRGGDYWIITEDMCQWFSPLVEDLPDLENWEYENIERVDDFDGYYENLNKKYDYTIIQVCVYFESKQGFGIDTIHKCGAFLTINNEKYNLYIDKEYHNDKGKESIFLNNKNYYLYKSRSIEKGPPKSFIYIRKLNNSQ